MNSYIYISFDCFNFKNFVIKEKLLKKNIKIYESILNFMKKHDLGHTISYKFCGKEIGDIWNIKLINNPTTYTVVPDLNILKILAEAVWLYYETYDEYFDDDDYDDYVVCRNYFYNI